MSESRLNGKTGEYIRFAVALVIAALVAYFTAQVQVEHRLTVTDGNLAVLGMRQTGAVELEQSHFEDMQRSLARIERAIERIEATGTDTKTGEPYAAQGRRR